MKGFFLKQLFSLVFVAVCTGAVFGQVREISGHVKDDEGVPLEGVTVEGGGVSSSTSEDGMFLLEEQAVGGKLVFSAIGYRAQTLTVPPEGELEVFMVKEQTDIDEVVVIGYGEQSRSTVTTSVSKVDAEEFDRAPGQNPLLQLQGKVAGLSLQVQDGQPGASPQIFIRGGSSTSPESDAPLFIVDGLVSQGTRSINDLNPDDIASVQVLKDAASTAIYGARAANGIVIVTTKKGKMGKPQINLRYTHGIEQQMKRLPLLNARDYVHLTRKNIAAFNTSNPEFFLDGGRYGMSTGNPRDANNTLAFLDDYINDYGQEYVDGLISQQGWETMGDPATGRKLLFQDNDYQKATFQTGGKQELDFDISGGTEKARYYFGLGYMNQDGIVRGTDYANYSALFNGDFKLSDKWSINTKFTYQLRKTNAPNNYEWVLSRSVLMPPTYRQYYENGLPAPGEGISSFRNRLHEMYYKTKYNDVNVHRTNLQVGANWDIL
ncbi:MAG: TonB-dependent receptor plug domain-containing protein, partial [Sphingobacterium sp.]